MEIFNWLEKLLISIGLNTTSAQYSNLYFNIFALIIVAYLLDIFVKKILIYSLTIVANTTKSTFDDFLVKNKTAKYIAHLFPLVLIYYTVPIIFHTFNYWEVTFEKGIKIYIIVLSLWIIRSIFNSLRDYLKNQPKYSDKPIDSYIQVIMILLWIFGTISFASILFSIGEKAFLTTLGSISAIIILVFRDTILGFVASISVSVNNMVRIGDWITMEKFGADGDVIEINLATVKVRNFDNTTTTIPTYSLISDSFKNWRGMENSDGRRIKRHILIKNKSIKFIKTDDLEYFKTFQLIKPYIVHRQKDIDLFNAKNNVDKSIILNGRNLTNLGLYRKYCEEYIKKHSGVNKEMTLMVRQLQPSEKGIPIEIYCFSNDKKWQNYEHIMADIFDHLLAVVPYFNLEIFEFETSNTSILE